MTAGSRSGRTTLLNLLPEPQSPGSGLPRETEALGTQPCRAGFADPEGPRAGPQGRQAPVQPLRSGPRSKDLSGATPTHKVVSTRSSHKGGAGARAVPVLCKTGTVTREGVPTVCHHSALTPPPPPTARTPEPGCHQPRGQAPRTCGKARALLLPRAGQGLECLHSLFAWGQGAGGGGRWAWCPGPLRLPGLGAQAQLSPQLAGQRGRRRDPLAEMGNPRAAPIQQHDYQADVQAGVA